MKYTKRHEYTHEISRTYFLRLLAFIFVAIGMLPGVVVAASIENLQITQSAKQIEIKGACAGRQVVINIFSANSSEPFYTAGAMCKDGAFFFKDNLGYWKIGTGQYRVAVYDENGPRVNPPPPKEKEFEIKNLANEITAENKSGAIEPKQKNENLRDVSEIKENVPETNGSLQKIWAAFQNINELIKSALASLGLFIENGIVRITELIAGKITADKASVKNLEILEEIQIRDHATGGNWCAWIENGEWRKELCEDNPPINSDTQTTNTDNNEPVISLDTANEEPSAIPSIETPITSDTQTTTTDNNEPIISLDTANEEPSAMSLLEIPNETPTTTETTPEQGIIPQ